MVGFIKAKIRQMGSRSIFAGVIVVQGRFKMKALLATFVLALASLAAASPNLVALKEWTWAPGINFTKQQVLVFEGDWISIHLVCEPVKPDMCSGAASYAYSGQLPTEFPIWLYRFTGLGGNTHVGMGLVAPTTGLITVWGVGDFKGATYHWTLEVTR